MNYMSDIKQQHEKSCLTKGIGGIGAPGLSQLATAFPSFRQAAILAHHCVDSWLQACLSPVAVSDEALEDEIRAVNVCHVVKELNDWLKDHPPSNFEEFSLRWERNVSALDAAVESMDNRNTTLFRYLTAARDMLRAQAEVLEMVDIAAKKISARVLS